MSRMGMTSEHEQMMCSWSWCLLATCSVLDNEIKPQHKAEPSLLLPETSHAERGPRDPLLTDSSCRRFGFEGEGRRAGPEGAEWRPTRRKT
jgi:hypothetical protein